MRVTQSERGRPCGRWGFSGAVGLLMLLLVLPPGTASAYVAYGGKGAPRGGARLADQQVVFHNVNAVRLAEVNTGQIGIDAFSNNGAGFFPGNTPNNYVFGTGTWLAGVGDVNGDGRSDTLFIQSYDPLSGGTEYREGKYTQETSDPLARLFQSTVKADLDAWPDEFKYVDNDPTSPTYGQRIPKVYSDQDIVGVYTTAGKAPLFATGSPPLQIEQRGIAFTAGLSAQAVFFILDISNISDKTGTPVEMRSAWMGYDSDMDVGAEFSDDRTSFIREQITPEGDTVRVNMGMVWDDNFDESNFVNKPGFIGIAYLQSPGNAFDGVDNDGDGLIDESPFNGVDDDGDGEIDDQPDEVDQLGLVNYTFHNNPSVPGPREDPQDDNSGYRIMSCTPPTECVETTAKSDVRFMIDSGPFQILPGETHRVVIAFVFANTSDPEQTRLDVIGDPPRPDPNDASLVEFLSVKATIQGIYDLNFLQASPPPPPNMTLVPGDGQVTILWDDSPLRAADKAFPDFVQLDSTYRQYDFQGFRVWRSRTGNFSRSGKRTNPLNALAQAENGKDPSLDLALLAQYDLLDGITDADGIFVRDSVIDQVGNVIVTKADTFPLGSDTGLKFSFVDRGDPGAPLVDGFRYFYFVSSYDYNSPKLAVSSLSLENGVSFPIANSAIPRSNASSFRSAARTGFQHVSPTGGAVDETTPMVDTTVTISQERMDSVWVKTLTRRPGKKDTTVITNKPPTVTTVILSAAGDTLDREQILQPLSLNLATNGLVGSSFTAIQHDRIPTGAHSLLIRDVMRPEGMDAGKVRVFYRVVDDATGREVPSSPGDTLSFFDFALDGTDQTSLVQVFNDSVSGGVLYENTVTFNTDATLFQRALPEATVPVQFLTFDADGNPINVGQVKAIAPGDVVPREFVRASDIEIVWENTGTEVRPVSVTDLDNQVPVAFVKPETTIARTDTTISYRKGSNWGFIQRGDVLLPDSSLTLPLGRSLQIYVSGVAFTIISPVTPETGDRWIVRQAALDKRILTNLVTDRDSVHVTTATQDIDSVFVDRFVTSRPIPAQRSPVPGARYRISLKAGGQEVGDIDLSRIRVVPNPYLGTARFEFGPDNRQIHFINLPPECTIRIYTISGNLVRMLEHTQDEGGTEVFDLRTRFNLELASGNYYYHITTPDGRTHMGRFAVIQ